MAFLVIKSIKVTIYLRYEHRVYFATTTIAGRSKRPFRV